MVFTGIRSSIADIKKKKPPGINRGLFRELEFKVFFRTVNQAGFTRIFGCFSDIGYVKISSISEWTQAQNSLIWVVILRFSRILMWRIWNCRK